MTVVMPASRLIDHWALPVDLRNEPEALDYQAHDLMLRMKVEHGDPVVVPQLPQMLVSRTGGVKLADLLEQLLGLLQPAPVLPNDRDGHLCQLFLTQLGQESVDDTGCRRRAGSDVDVWFCSHSIPAAWFAVRPRKL